MFLLPRQIFEDVVVNASKIRLYEDELEIKRDYINNLLVDNVLKSSRVGVLEDELVLANDYIVILEDKVDWNEKYMPVIVTVSCIGGGIIGYMLGDLVGGD